MDETYLEGWEASKNGSLCVANPYRGSDLNKAHQWNKGWWYQWGNRK